MSESTPSSPGDLATTLSEQAAQLRSAQRIARLGTYVLDVALGRWTSSEMLDEIFGLTGDPRVRDVALWAELIHPDDRADMVDYFTTRVIGRGERFDREYRIVRPADGVVRWVHGCGELTLDAAGRPTQMIGTIQDCTDRYDADAALRAAHARLTEMFEGAHDAIFLADVETGVIVDANRAATRLLGRPKHEIIGLHQTQLHPPDRLADHRKKFEEHVHDTTLVMDDSELLSADGARIPVEVTASIVELPDGRRVIQGIFRDITRRRQAEAELRHREARLASVFQAVPVGLFVVADRRFLEVNPYVTLLTGYTPEDLVGQFSRVLYADDEQFARVGREAYETIRREGSCRIETTWRHKDGRLLDIILSAAPIVHEGQTTATTFAALDVTERRRLEAQLRQAQKMEAVGQLAGGVAHDFNNILTAILLQLAFLKEEGISGPEAAEALGDIHRGANRAADLTRQLLLFSRRQVMRRQPVDVNQVIVGMLRMLHRVLGENIEIKFRSAADAPWIEGDPGMIEQVLMNLCINARDAMPGGGVLTLGTDRISLDTTITCNRTDRRPGTCLRLSVTDTGSGMTDEVKGHIFEPFFTTKDVGKGTGLGLATVLGIVQQHGGSIEVDSAVGRGSTFTILLPECPAPAESSAPSPPAPAAEVVRRGSELILVVEDEAAVRRPIATVLRRHGYRVLEAAESREALEHWSLQGSAIDLVISDIVMPGRMSGLELCERLTAQRPDLPVIVLSGYNPETTARQPSSPDHFVHMAKPCDSAALTRIVGELLERSRPRA
ncbi:MAG: PAS domain S-box protein [Opitutaceae bacterium]|nr:PAS domain S-box protein [Opitutaceae bacterium]